MVSSLTSDRRAFNPRYDFRHNIMDKLFPELGQHVWVLVVEGSFHSASGHRLSSSRGSDDCSWARLSCIEFTRGAGLASLPNQPAGAQLAYDSPIEIGFCRVFPGYHRPIYSAPNR